MGTVVQQNVQGIGGEQMRTQDWGGTWRDGEGHCGSILRIREWIVRNGTKMWESF